jgi:NADPH:quinone reductase-like Zn-dependent oxidoreductase
MTPPTAAVTEESTSHFAVVAADYGGSEVLSVVDAEVPPPGPGEATIEVRAAGVNPIDRKLYSGAWGRRWLPPPASEIKRYCVKSAPSR